MARILITRSPHQSSELADRVRALGAEAVLIPTIELADPASFAALDAALGRLDRFHWLVFTSANAVQAFQRRAGAKAGHMAPEIFPQIASIGPATSRALESFGMVPALVPAQAVAESLVEALLPLARQTDGSATRFLMVRAESVGENAPRDILPDALGTAGADVTIAAAYRTIIPAASIEAIRALFCQPATFPDAITFTSSSTARNLFTLLEAAGVGTAVLGQAGGSGIQHPAPVLASIGPITSATLRELGHPPHVEAPEANVASLAESLVEFLGGGRVRAGQPVL